ncbi:hypothetical protein [Aeromonas veronii]
MEQGVKRTQRDYSLTFKLALVELGCPGKIGQSRIKQPELFSNTSC